MEEIVFPFERGKEFALGELRAFESSLSDRRQLNPALSGELRCNKVAWAKTRNEELVPLKLFVDHHALPDDDRFILMPPGDAVDVQLTTRAGQIPFQVTVVDPAWTAP